MALWALGVSGSRFGPGFFGGFKGCKLSVVGVYGFQGSGGTVIWGLRDWVLRGV